MNISVKKEKLENLVSKCPELRDIIDKSYPIIDGIYSYDIDMILEANEIREIFEEDNKEKYENIMKYLSKRTQFGDILSDGTVEDMLNDLTDSVYFYLKSYFIEHEFITTEILYKIFGLSKFNVFTQENSNRLKFIGEIPNKTKIFANEDILCVFDITTNELSCVRMTKDVIKNNFYEDNIMLELKKNFSC